MRLKKIILWTVCVLLGLTGVSAAAVGIILNEKTLLRIIDETAPGFINGELRVRGAHASLLRTFPHLGFRLDSVSLENSRGELLFSADRAELSVNIGKLVAGRSLSVESVTVGSPSVCFVRDSLGRSNWDGIMKEGTASPQDTSQTGMMLRSAAFRKMEISGAKVYFDDAASGLKVDMRGGRLAFRGGFGMSGAGGAAEFGADSLSVQSGQYLKIRNRPVSLSTRVGFRRDSLVCRFSGTEFSSGAVKLSSSGSLDFSKKGEIGTEISYDFGIGSLSDILALIPETVVPDAASAKVRGSVSSSGTVSGKWGNGEFPVAEGGFLIEDGAVAYKGMPASLDTVELELRYRLDLNDRKTSRLMADTLTVAGDGIELRGSGKFRNILDDPRIQANLNADIDLGAMARIFPFADGVVMEGRARIDRLSARVKMADVRKGDYGKIRTRGRFSLEGIKVYFPEDTTTVIIRSASGSLGSNTKNRTSLQGVDLLRGRITTDSLSYISKHGLRVSTDSLYAEFGTSPLKDTSAIATMTAGCSLGKTSVYMKDTLFVGLKSLSLKSGLGPLASNPKKPVVTASFKADSVRGRYTDKLAGIDSAAIDMTLLRLAKKDSTAIWVASGQVHARNFRFFTPSFPLRIRAKVLDLRFDREGIHLDNAEFRAGRSDIALTGSIGNFWRGLYLKEKMTGRLDMTSSLLNVNQLMRAAEKGRSRDTTIHNMMLAAGDNIDNTSSMTVEDTTAVQIDKRLPAIPDMIDFTFSTKIDRIRIGRGEIKDFTGNIRLSNHTVHLSNLWFTSDAVTKVEGKAMYSCQSPDKAYIGFQLDLGNAVIDSVSSAFPAIDSLLPMVQSLKGNIDFFVAAETEVDSTMRADISTLKGGLHLEGRNLTLLDGETFAEIAKMLKFQNRSRNIIDSVAANISLEDGLISVYPFILSMDRYLIAAGGEQKMSGDFKYHISLLESPVVFRVGIDITGNPDKMKYKITKARYKDVRQATRQSKIDSTALEITDAMLRRLQIRRGPVEEPLL